MSEREELIAKITDIATKEAKKQKLNEAQTKLYVETKLQKALEGFDEKHNKNEITTNEVNTTVESSEESGMIEGSKKVNKEKRYTVYTPVKNFCGVIAKVHFAYGKAEVKPGWVLNWFKEHGYRIEEVSV